MHTVRTTPCATGSSDYNQSIGLSLLSGVDALGEVQETGGSLVYFLLTHLDFYGSPATPRQGHQSIDLVAVFVSPCINTTIETLSIDAKVPDNEGLQSSSTLLLYHSRGPSCRCQGPLFRLGGNEIAGCGCAQPGARAHVRLPGF